MKIFWFIQKLAFLGCIYKSKILQTALVYTTVLSYIISRWKYGIRRDFFSSYSRLMPKCTLSRTRRSQQQRLKRNVPWQPKVLLGPTQWRLWRKRRNNQSFHDRISSEELNIEFRINGCQKVDVLIKTKHDKRLRSRSADFLAVTFL